MIVRAPGKVVLWGEYAVLDAALQVAVGERPVVVHAFLSPASGRAPSAEAFLQAFRSGLPPLPTALFGEPLTAGRAGADVILADEDTAMGGRLLREREDIDGMPAAEWVASALDELEVMPNVRLMTRTTVTGAYDQGTYGALERIPGPRATGKPIECFWRIVAKRSVLCAGALERPIAFPNNDRPGIMLASGVRAYVNRWGVAPGKSVAVFGNNDDPAGILVETVNDAWS